MTLKYMEGFDQLTGQTDILTPLNASGYVASGSLAIVPGRVANQRCLQIGAAGVASFKKTFTSTQTKVILGFAYNASADRQDIVTIPNLGTLSWSADTGKIAIAGATGTAILLLGLWYYFEIVLDKGDMSIKVYVNNGLDVTAVAPSSAQFLSTFDCTWAATTSAKLLDDVVFIDNSVGKYVDRVGPVQITSRLPGVDVDKEWSPSTGSDHWPLVDNQPPVDTDFVQSNVSGAIDSYKSNTPLPANSSILAVGLTVLNKKSDIDARQLGLVVGQKGTTQTEVLDTNLSTSPKYSYAVFETAPGSAAWTDELVASTAFGVVVRP